MTPSPSNASLRPEFIDFVGNILVRHVEVEAIVRCRLHPDTHPYLVDHNYKGALIMPTVFGLEAMAQVVLLALPQSLANSRQSLDQRSWVIENIKLTRPIPVGPKGVEIEIYAEILEEASKHGGLRVKCGVRSEATGYAHDHFAAEFIFEDSQPPSQVGDLNQHPFPRGAYEKADLGINPQTDLYGTILFQGPSFQQIKSICHLESDNESHGKAVLKADCSPLLQEKFLLGDPYFRDALLQSAQLIIPQNQCLPIAIAKLELFSGYTKCDQQLIFTEVNRVDAKSYLATIEVTDQNGIMRQRLQQYRLQFLEKRPQLPKAMDLPRVRALAPASAKAGETLSPPLETMDTQMADANPLMAAYRGPAEQLRIDATAGGPQDQSVFIHRFIPDFKTFANLGNGIYFSHIFNWMGSAREMSSIPVLAELRTLTESGQWGQVTNWASIEVLGDCRNEHRIVESRLWCSRLGGTKNSSATLSFDWLSRSPNGIEERIARGQMGFTWVEILAHGVVQPAPLPQNYQLFIESMSAKNDAPNVYPPANEPFKTLQPGRSIFKTSGGPRSVIPLSSKTFETSTFDSNLVGNIYFGNYSIWMGRVRDSFFYRLAPQYFTKSAHILEMLCTKSRIQHIRESMPYDEIEVTMGLSQLYQAGADLQFEFFRKRPNGAIDKLAFSEHHVIWTHKAQSGQVSAQDWPEEITHGLLQAINGRLNLDLRAV